METILITGARAPIALDLARSFHAAGHRVVMADSLSLTIARWSNSVSEYYRHASPRFDSLQFISDIKRIIRKEQISHIVPTCEEGFYLSAHAAHFNCKVWIAPSGLMNQLHNKFIFTRLVKEFLKTPATVLLSEFTDWENSENYVFKPVYSRFATRVSIGKKRNPDEFPLAERHEWIAQEYIPGKEICFYTIWEEGRLKAFSSYHPLYRVGQGAGIFFENLHHSRAYESIKAFGEQVRYTGQLSFDAILDTNKEAVFIECNPRATSGGHLINTRLAGAFLNNSQPERQTGQEYCIKYGMMLLQPARFFGKRVRQSKDVIFSRQDMRPFFLQGLSLLEITLVKFRRRCSWLEAATGDIEWNESQK